MMSKLKTVIEKLRRFTIKYYVSELIKGIILFFSLGVLYLFFILFLEYLFWLKPMARTFLFWFFIVVEIFLLVRFILVPIFKLIGLRKGISAEEAAIIVGNHFPEVKDKLLNVIQLKEKASQSDLLVASINQKSEELEFISFVKAVDFTKNKKYLKYTMVPILIWILLVFTGSKSFLNQSLDRVMHHRTSYLPPAPFSFSLINKDLQVVQGGSITIFIEIKGSIVPSEVKILFDNQEYYLQNNDAGNFSFSFSNVQKAINFYVEANGVLSQVYEIKVTYAPTINNIYLQLTYPYYIGKKNETIQGSGDVMVPEGTNVTWKVNASQTEEVFFINNKRRNIFTKISENRFVFSKEIKKSLEYQISSSNRKLQNYENLLFSLEVIKDEIPKISMQTNIDSISRGIAQFVGQVSDDYGIQKLQLVYYNESKPQLIKTYALPISKANVQTFFYQFPFGLTLEKGINYKFYFEVFDNDAINGNKRAKSNVFKYKQKTDKEIEEELLQEQRMTIYRLENAIQNQKKEQQGLSKIQQELQRKKTISWSEKKNVQSFIKRQEEYKKRWQRYTDKLQENLDGKKAKNERLQDQKQLLKERIEELKKMDKHQRLLEEIAKMAEKLNKEGLIRKAKELAQQNKQQERSLERTLELVKRFYVEQKTMQIANKLAVLSKKQGFLEKKEETSIKEQKEINEKFIEIKKQIEELSNDNEALKEPLGLTDVEEEKEMVDEALKKAVDNLQKQEQKKAKKEQKTSAQKMKEMSSKMEQAMLDIAAQSVEENSDDLRKILENLMMFSFKQENLMNKFRTISTIHPNFGKELKEQNDIRNYFEHIDDSLYVLCMRLPKISAKIQDDLSRAHYNLEQSLENFSENRFDKGISNQRYVMISANNLADYLSNILSSMKSASLKKGKGKKGGFSLPDIIKKQGELSEKMKDGMKKGKKSGNKKGEGKEGKKSGEKGKQGEEGKRGKGSEGKGVKYDPDGELYEIYKQQSELRQQLEAAIKAAEKDGSNRNGAAKNALKTMEQLEKDILEKGFNAGTIEKIQRLNYELLKLNKATLEQGKDKKRNASLSLKENQRNKKKALEFKKRFYNQIEILNRQSLPLQQAYKLKVREYFSEPKNLE